MDKQLRQNLDKFSQAFTPVMHFFHNIANDVSKVAEFSLAQFRVLMMVQHVGPMTINDLKTRLHIAQSTASEMVDRLVQQGLLLRKKDKKDRRITVFELTDEARKLLEEQKSSIRECYRKVLEPLGAEEQRDLVQAFETILRIIRRLDEEHTKIHCNNL